MSSPPTRDAEIKALGDVLKTLASLDVDARRRIVAHAQSWCADAARKEKEAAKGAGAGGGR